MLESNTLVSYSPKLSYDPAHVKIELLKNSMIQINKTASNVHFNEAEMDKEINFSITLFYFYSKTAVFKSVCFVSVIFINRSMISLTFTPNFSKIWFFASS